MVVTTSMWKRASSRAVLSFVSLICAAAGAQGQSTCFIGPASIDTGSMPRGLAAADFNQDGHSDLAIASWGG